MVIYVAVMEPLKSRKMKLLFIPMLFLLLSGFIQGQNGDSVNPNFSGILEQEAETDVHFLSEHLVVSTGFLDSQFEDSVEIHPGESPADLVLTTSYLKPLQYTVSNVEGIILKRGRFIGEENLDFSRRSEGDYAVYIFAANRVVRAFMVSREESRSINYF